MKKSSLILMSTACALSLMMTGCNNEAKEYYEQAVKYSEEKDYDSAKEYFEKAIEADSEKAEYYIDYGFTLIECGEYTEAVAEFNKAILSSDEKIVDPDNQITRRNNKMAYRGKAIAYFESSDYENAITFFEYALDIDELTDMDTDITMYLADALKYTGQYDKAIEYFDNVLKKNETAKVYAAKAECEYVSGDYDKAYEDYEKAIKLDDTVYEYYFGMYNVCIAKGNKKEAAKVMENALSITSKSEEADFNKGKIYYMLGQMDKAKECLDKAKASGIAQADLYLGLVSSANNDSKGVIDSLSEYVKTEEGRKSSNAYSLLAKAYIEERSFDKALDCANAGIKINDIGVMKDLKRAQISAYEGQGKFSKALKKAKEYIKQYPDDTDMEREIEFLNTRKGE